MTTIKVMPDYCAAPLWAPDSEEFNYNVSPSELGLSDKLGSDLKQWAYEYTATLNEEDPAMSGFPSREAEMAFVEAGRRLAKQVRTELGKNYRVLFCHYGKFGHFDEEVE